MGNQLKKVKQYLLCGAEYEIYATDTIESMDQRINKITKKGSKYRKEINFLETQKKNFSDFYANPSNFTDEHKDPKDNENIGDDYEVLQQNNGDKILKDEQQQQQNFETYENSTSEQNPIKIGTPSQDIELLLSQNEQFFEKSNGLITILQTESTNFSILKLLNIEEFKEEYNLNVYQCPNDRITLINNQTSGSEQQQEQEQIYKNTNILLQISNIVIIPFSEHEETLESLKEKIEKITQFNDQIQKIVVFHMTRQRTYEDQYIPKLYGNQLLDTNNTIEKTLENQIYHIKYNYKSSPNSEVKVFHFCLDTYYQNPSYSFKGLTEILFYDLKLQRQQNLSKPINNLVQKHFSNDNSDYQKYFDVFGQPSSNIIKQNPGVKVEVISERYQNLKFEFLNEIDYSKEVVIGVFENNYSDYELRDQKLIQHPILLNMQYLSLELIDAEKKNVLQTGIYLTDAKFIGMKCKDIHKKNQKLYIIYSLLQFK